MSFPSVLLKWRAQNQGKGKVPGQLARLCQLL
jgi:hypothetical protein